MLKWPCNPLIDESLAYDAGSGGHRRLVSTVDELWKREGVAILDPFTRKAGMITRKHGQPYNCTVPSDTPLNQNRASGPLGRRHSTNSKEI